MFAIHVIATAIFISQNGVDTFIMSHRFLIINGHMSVSKKLVLMTDFDCVNKEFVLDVLNFH